MKIVKNSPSVDIKKMKMRKAVEIVKSKRVDIKWGKGAITFTTNRGLTEKERDLLREVFTDGIVL